MATNHRPRGAMVIERTFRNTRSRRANPWQAGLALLVLITFAVRARFFGDPLIHVDEEFYLLAGDRMLHGALPYVDIWDRKPVGLFLLYAAIRLLGGDGIIQYQLVASAFAAATAVMIAVMARRISTPAPALLAALLYVPALAMNGGQGGQAPVFYNLPVAVAAWIVMRLVDATDHRAIRRRGAVAMLLVGIAIQIKYSAVFEGGFFGLVLIASAWKAGPRRAVVVADIGLWVAMALLPTLIAFAVYALLGHAQDFVYANFLSIGARAHLTHAQAWRNLRHILIRLLPFAVPILVGEWLLRERLPWVRSPEGRTSHRFLAGWLAAAMIGFLLFGTYFDHYALPLLPPIVTLAAPTFAIAHRHVGRVLSGVGVVVLFLAYPLNARRTELVKGDAAYARRLVAEIEPRLNGGCLYIFVGEPILYHLTGSCLPSRWAFPYHLAYAREASALGVNPIAEARRIMATHPPVVLDRLNDSVKDLNPDVQRLVETDLRRDYRVAFSFTHPSGEDAYTDRVWVLRTRDLSTPIAM